MMLSFILTMLMRRCCQRALIRAMNAVLSYYNFWLPGLMRDFLFEVLEDVWAPVLRDSFKMILIFCWLYQLNYRGGSTTRWERILLRTSVFSVIKAPVSGFPFVDHLFGCLYWYMVVS